MRTYAISRSMMESFQVFSIEPVRRFWSMVSSRVFEPRVGVEPKITQVIPITCSDIRVSVLARGRPLRAEPKLGELEEGARRRAARARERLQRLPPRARDRRRNPGKKGGLVAAGGGLGSHVARQQIRAVGFDQQPPGGDLRHEGGEMAATALIADPAGDPDRQPQLEITRQLLRRAGEAMRHAAPGGRVLAQDGHEIGVRLALVQEHRLAEAQCELELTVEGTLLRIAGREVPVVIEPAFSDRDDLGRPGELLELRLALRSELARMMG